MNRGAQVPKLGYLAAATALFAIELLIALFVRDDFMRPYVGDVLAIILVYATVRAATPLGVSASLGLTMAVALSIEISQALGLVGLLGLDGNRIARIVLGGVFDWADLAAYAVGGMIVAAIEFTLARKNAEEGEHG